MGARPQVVFLLFRISCFAKFLSESQGFCAIEKQIPHRRPHKTGRVRDDSVADIRRERWPYPERQMPASSISLTDVELLIVIPNPVAPFANGGEGSALSSTAERLNPTQEDFAEERCEVRMGMLRFPAYANRDHRASASRQDNALQNFDTR
jgi:hypothetical protein